MPNCSKREFMQAHLGQPYRQYTCPGKNCGQKITAIQGATVWCGTPGCLAGRMRPGRVVSSRRFAEEAWRDLNP